MITEDNLEEEMKEDLNNIQSKASPNTSPARSTIRNGTFSVYQKDGGSVTYDTFFDKEIKSWIKSNEFDYDKDFLDQVNKVILDTFKKTISLQMSLDDFEKSIKRYAIDVSWDKQQLVKYYNSILSIYCIGEYLDILIPEYKNDIIIRLIESNFGKINSELKSMRDKEISDDKIKASMVNALSRITSSCESLQNIEKLKLGKVQESKSHIDASVAEKLEKCIDKLFKNTKNM